MADVKISDLPAGITLTGIEKVPMDQIIMGTPTTVTASAQDIANLKSVTLQEATSGSNRDLVDGNNFQGTNAGGGNTGTDVIGIATEAAGANSGDSVVAIGFSAGNGNSGDGSVFIGAYAGNANAGNNVFAFGTDSAFQNQGANVVAMLGGAPENLGDNVFALGVNAASQNEGDNVIAMGITAAQNNTGNNINAFGSGAGNGNGYNNVNLFGENAEAEADNQTVFSRHDTVAARFGYGNLTFDRTYELPNKSGTVALTSDIVTPYKEYVGIFSQVGTSVPTVQVVNNTLGGTVIWTRSTAGQYTATLASVFTNNKTVVITMNQSLPVADRVLFMSQASTSTVNVLCRKISDSTFADWGQSGAASIEIRVYN